VENLGDAQYASDQLDGDTLRDRLEKLGEKLDGINEMVKKSNDQVRLNKITQLYLKIFVNSVRLTIYLFQDQNCQSSRRRRT